MGSSNVRKLCEVLSKRELANRDPWHLPSHYFVANPAIVNNVCFPTNLWLGIARFGNKKFGPLDPLDMVQRYMAEKSALPDLLTKLDVPSSSPTRTYFMAPPVNAVYLFTDSGYWKENRDELTAIRSGESSSSTTTPDYIGLRRTLEFYRKDNTKTDWVIHEYSHLRHHDRRRCEPFLILQERVVIRKVFKKDTTHQTSSRYRESRDDGDVRTMHLCKQLQDEVDSLLESAKSDYDDVWQHFTKIRNADPDVVYAACHRCDKVVTAHPNKHGTNHLRSHMSSAKCRSSCGNPSTDEDREMLRRLRVVLDDLSEQQRMDGKLQCQEVNTQQNPWDLGHDAWYVTVTTPLMSLQTNQGCWEEIDKEFTAIRTEELQMQEYWMAIGNGEITTAVQGDYQMQMQVPQYMGLRKTLEFHLNQNGNKLKTGWIMLEYQQVHDMEPPVVFLQGRMVIRKISHYDKDAVSGILSDLDRSLNGDNDNEERNNGKGVNKDPILSSDYMNGGGDRKRKRSSKRTSEVWMYFTEIRTADPKVVYAVCHHCDRGYGSGASTNGTSHLGRHKKSCTSKPRGTGNVSNGANAAWEAEIWPLFLLLKKYGETEH